MKIAILGYGKMGRTIDQLIQADFPQHEVILRIDKHNANELTTSQLSKADVAIEFTQPEIAYENIKKCFAANVPIVVGTTAWYDKFEEIKTACMAQEQALFYATNFSIGVNIFFALNKKLAQLMKPQRGYDLKIDEIHHTEKLDAPSGTAITLANGIINENEDKRAWANQPTEDDHLIPIISHRQPKVKGTHIITYESAIDKIAIEHVAHSREGFAKGAILAAQWLEGKKGVYTMADMLAL